MANSNLQKVGRVMVKNGTYKDKDGNEKTRWHEIGIMFATPHHSQLCIKLHANGFGEGQFASVFYDDDKKPNFIDREPLGGRQVDDIAPEDIPF